MSRSRQISSINEDVQNLEEMLQFLKANTVFRKIQLLKFHKLGGSKYEDLGLEDPFGEYDTLQEADLDRLKELVKAYDFIDV